MGMLEEFFEDCKKGIKGVMPYCEADRKITFVWTNGKGYGRISESTLTKEGRKLALKLYKEIEELNKKKLEAKK